MRRNNIPSIVYPKPKIPGSDIAGIVEDAPDASGYQKGDRVFAMLPLLGTMFGGYAEYVALPSDQFHHIPYAELSDAEVASMGIGR